MEAYRGNRGTAPLFLDLSTRWRSVVNFTLWPLYARGMNTWYPRNRWLGRPHNQYGLLENRKCLALSRIQTLALNSSWDINFIIIPCVKHWAV
jgi:hypothetical protein